MSNSSSTMSSASTRAVTSLSVRMPALPRPFTWAREPARSSFASVRSKGRLTVNVRHGVRHAGRDATLPQRHGSPPPSGAAVSDALTRPSPRVGARSLAGRPRGHPEAPQADETLGVGVPEGVRRVVGRQPVVVERDRAAPTHDGARARRGEAQPHLAGHVALALGDEGLRGPSGAASTTGRRRRARTSAAPGAPSRGAGRARASGPRGRRGRGSATGRPGTRRPPGS